MTPPGIKRSRSASPDDNNHPSTPKKSKASAKNTPTKTFTPKASKDAWTVDQRLALFHAYQAVVEVSWDKVAEKMGEGMTGKQCREQWQRATRAKILKALGEK